ncbi:hypothetical protein WMY93_025901 [Mugilogobius chulae]|uniref:Uncharacterized protein n=1 Tax=Mugilogobius chulae TaxID=88201 RepID=A0AAW0N7U3_9GOBI
MQKTCKQRGGQGGGPERTRQPSCSAAYLRATTPPHRECVQCPEPASACSEPIESELVKRFFTPDLGTVLSLEPNQVEMGSREFEGVVPGVWGAEGGERMDQLFR